MTPPRLPDWEDRLSAYLTRPGAARFVWGANDCALFGSGAGAAMTGHDGLAKFRGRYRSRQGAARVLREIGEGTLILTMDAAYESRDPAFAQRGDLVMAEKSVGVCMGAFGLFLTTESDEFVRIPRRAFTHGWRV